MYISKKKIIFLIVEGYKKGDVLMNIEVLMTTAHKNNIQFIQEKNISSDLLIINTTFYDHLYTITKKVRLINSSKSSISENVNIMLNHSKGDICVLSNDETIFISDYEYMINKAYEDNPQYDVIVFQYLDILRGLKKNYKKSKRKINYCTLNNVELNEITFKRDKVLENGIKFNTNFGYGTKYNHGVASLFLKSCLNNNLRVLYIPEPIVIRKNNIWYTELNDKLFSIGATYFELYGYKSYLYLPYFTIKNKLIYRKKLSIMKIFINILKGINSRKNDI